ncbi:hypothetical protein EAF04_009490 [Stromatinia cepivora]|nr:hypothetical protein EAF04_009490 [Stromatinia cepivora]
MAPLRAFWNMNSLYPLGVTTFLYFLVVNGPSAPRFDILTLHETRQGCLILIMLFSYYILFLQRLHAIGKNEQLQSVTFLGCVVIVGLFAWSFQDSIKSAIETERSELLPEAIKQIPVALTFLVELLENIIICVRAGWDNAVLWLKFLIAKAQAKFLGILAELTRRIGYVPDTHNGL